MLEINWERLMKTLCMHYYCTARAFRRAQQTTLQNENKNAKPTKR